MYSPSPRIHKVNTPNWTYPLLAIESIYSFFLVKNVTIHFRYFCRLIRHSCSGYNTRTLCTSSQTPPPVDNSAQVLLFQSSRMRSVRLSPRESAFWGGGGLPAPWHCTTPLWTDRQRWKHYLPATSFADGNKSHLSTGTHLCCNRDWQVK